MDQVFNKKTIIGNQNLASNNYCNCGALIYKNLLGINKVLLLPNETRTSHFCFKIYM